MSDVKFVIIMMSILIGILVWYVLKMIGITNKYYGEKSFVKIPTVFEVTILNSIGFFTILLIILALLGLWTIIYGFLNPLKDIYSVVMMVLVGLLVITIPVFELYRFYVFFQLNGASKKYFFEPEERMLTIISHDEFSFKKVEIVEVVDYCFNFKESMRNGFFFRLIILKNGEKVVFTEILPFFSYLEEFYGNIESKRIFVHYSKLFEHIAWFKTLH
jgi:magnesium-transporting ATPase (P-type)